MRWANFKVGTRGVLLLGNYSLGPGLQTPENNWCLQPRSFQKLPNCPPPCFLILFSVLRKVARTRVFHCSPPPGLHLCSNLRLFFFCYEHCPSASLSSCGGPAETTVFLFFASARLRSPPPPAPNGGSHCRLSCAGWRGWNWRLALAWGPLGNPELSICGSAAAFVPYP